MLVNVVVLVAILASKGLAQLPPIPSLIPGQPIDLQKCNASLQSVQGCLKEFSDSLGGSQIQILGPACCKAVTEIDENCWPKLFPTNPFLLQVIKTSCAVWPPSSDSKLKFPNLPSWLTGKDFADCFSSLTDIPGCASAIRDTINSGQIKPLAPACCNAIASVGQKCWPKFVPVKPLLLGLLEQACSLADLVAPSTKN